ncbi:hypothetical protein GOBAR_AA24388 [Gossypium barbadense]|uniref:DUF4283 domain-containing protein n=1 Tax=Gossypium barbadense TaxID=3634 RepID=A0A2P5WZ18_GOSBA|nr:hypothetical protein GOBAR_AA24388 [Gossypium barbadense]
MKSTMANLWHPVRGVQIQDLKEKRFLFQFFHAMDMDRVLKGSPWTFNNHLLILHPLQWGEDPLKIPLIFSPFWVQIHTIPMGFFYENLARQLGYFLGKFMEYDNSDLGKGKRNFMRIRVQWDVRHTLKRKKQLREDGEDDTGESLLAGCNSENRPWEMWNKSEIGVSIDPILGINLEGNWPSSSQWEGNLLAKQSHSIIEHDLE